MLLSKSCEYGLRAALYVATRQEDTFIPIREISDRLGISFHFLTKIIQTLTQHGIMHSFRGPNGGVALARPASGVKLVEIVEAIDGPGLFTECVLGLPGCGSRKPCPLHEQWSGTRWRIHEMLAGATLAELGAKVSAQNLRLSEQESVIGEL